MTLATNDAIDSLVASSPDEDLLAVASAFAGGKSEAPTIARLAERLARSGTGIAGRRGASADVASTGGPGSLSTLLGPLYLVAAGLQVPKLGVPGRPAGGVDCLAQVPGYRVRLSISEIEKALETCGYAHFLPTESFAPLDGRLFNLRQRHGLQSVPALVIASLLAKKIAVGIARFTIDIRVSPHGNFGGSWDEARRNGRLLLDTATLVGLSAAAILTDGRFPPQAYFGRKESLWALREIFEGRSEGELAAHERRCRTLAQACMPRPSNAASAAELRKILAANLVAQGASEAAFDNLVDETAAAHTNHLTARHDGYCNVDLSRLRSTLVEAQRRYATEHELFPDPLGLKLVRHQGEWVESGEVVATVRAPAQIWDACADSLAEAIAMPSRTPTAVGFEGVI